ncbi:MAG: DNA polymerase III subunit chi [Gammaproteobacteria bacterium]|nr:DNA polymerase III subunit chi [Gammaproteobacteria bacterium]
MTKIDFYLLSASGQVARDAMACKLVNKIYLLQHRVYIHVASKEDAARLDDALWTFTPGSFIPHSIYQLGKDSSEPVVIGCQDIAPQSDDVLLNLTADVPSFFSQFDRVAELVDAEENSRAQARIRFKFYKDRGYDLTTHELNMA